MMMFLVLEMNYLIMLWLALEPKTCAEFEHVNPIATDVDELKLLSF
jgi:hypothetical protein